MSKIRLIFAGTVICGAFLATAASAAPIAPVSSNAAGKIEQVRWVCGPYGRCWWQPNYYGYYGYGYAPRPYYWRHRYWRRPYHW